MTDNKREVATTSDTECSSGAAGDVPASSPPTAASAAAPITRDEKGRFVPGVSGNPKGPPKGLKQRITVHKETLEEALRSYAGKEKSMRQLHNAWDRVLNIAVDGEDKDAVAAFRAFSKHVMSELKPEDPSAGVSARDVKVEIHNHTGGNAPAVDVVIDDVQYEDISNG